MSREAMPKKKEGYPRVLRSEKFRMPRFVLLCLLVMIILGCSANMAINESLHSDNFIDAAGLGTVEEEALSHGFSASKQRKIAGSEQRMMLRGPRGETETSSSSSSLGETYSNQMDLSLNKLKASGNKKSLDTMLVHTGRLSVSVEFEDFPSFEKQLQAIVSDTGNGYFQSKSSDNSGTRYQSMHMTIRVHSDKFDGVIEDIRAIAKSVDNLSTNTRDVTDEFIDTSARADVLEAARSSLQTLLAKAQTVNEIVSLQRELNSLTESAESLRQRALNLKKDSEYSTLTLDVRTARHEPHPVMEKMLMPQHVMYIAFDHIYNLFITVANVVVYIAVWFVPFGLLLALAYLLCAPKQMNGTSQPSW